MGPKWDAALSTAFGDPTTQFRSVLQQNSHYYVLERMGLGARLLGFAMFGTVNKLLNLGISVSSFQLNSLKLN